MLRSDVVTVVQGLGTLDGKGGILRSSATSDALKRLEMLLKRDDPQVRSLHLSLGNMKVIQQYLIPLVECYPDDEHLVFIIRSFPILVCIDILQSESLFE
jgi:hypothetical protein